MKDDSGTTSPRSDPFGRDRIAPSQRSRFGRSRRVAVLAVHHVRVGDRTYTGGAEKYVRRTIGALLDAGATVYVGYSGTSIYNDLFLRAEPGRLTLEHTGWINDALSGDARLQVGTILARRRWLRRTGADTVFAVQQACGGAFAASLVAARLLGLRVVSSVRQPPEPLPPATSKRWFGLIPSPQLWRRRLFWRRRLPAWCCDAIIFNSHRVAAAYHELYGFPRHRDRIIYNGEPARPLPDRPSGCAPRHIASVGRVTEAKGADVLLDSFAAIADRHPDVRLTYYGDGPLVVPLREKARTLGLADRVCFAGYQPDHEAIYPNIDIYVQASRRESMSNSVVEAMARGIPCVVSDVGGLPETVDDGRTGFVIPAGRPDLCASALSRLLADRETFARFGGASIERVRRYFDVNKVMQETVETILGTASEAR